VPPHTPGAPSPMPQPGKPPLCLTHLTFRLLDHPGAMVDFFSRRPATAPQGFRSIILSPLLFLKAKTLWPPPPFLLVSFVLDPLFPFLSFLRGPVILHSARSSDILSRFPSPSWVISACGHGFILLSLHPFESPTFIWVRSLNPSFSASPPVRCFPTFPALFRSSSQPREISFRFFYGPGFPRPLPSTPTPPLAALPPCSSSGFTVSGNSPK